MPEQDCFLRYRIRNIAALPTLQATCAARRNFTTGKSHLYTHWRSAGRASGGFKMVLLTEPSDIGGKCASPSALLVQRQITRKWYKTDSYTYNSWQIGSRIWSIEQRHFQWSWMTPNSLFKVTTLFHAEYLRNGWRYSHSCYRIQIGKLYQSFGMTSAQGSTYKDVAHITISH